MKPKMLIKAGLVALLGLLPASVQAWPDVGVAISIQPATLTVIDDSQEAQGSSNLMGLEFSLRGERWYGGLALTNGDFHFTEQLPRREDNKVLLNGNGSIGHNQQDLVLGYYVLDWLSLFTDIKTANYVWSDDFALHMAGLGAGASAHWRASQNWTLLLRVGRNRVNIYNNAGTDVGNARGTTFYLGGLYLLRDDTALSAGLKNQSYNVSFRNDLEQQFAIGGITVSLNHLF